jgi:hypothetical protein
VTDHDKAVLAKHPRAEAVYHKPVPGAVLPPDRDGHWVIYKSHELGAELLGGGATEEAAWEDAAAKIGEAGGPPD